MTVAVLGSVVQIVQNGCFGQRLCIRLINYGLGPWLRAVDTALAGTYEKLHGIHGHWNELYESGSPQSKAVPTTPREVWESSAGCPRLTLTGSAGLVQSNELIT